MPGTNRSPVNSSVNDMVSLVIDPAFPISFGVTFYPETKVFPVLQPKPVSSGFLKKAGDCSVT
jgi:hypothetical protein